MERRRDFLQGLLAGLGAPLLAGGANADAGEPPPIGPLAAAEGVPGAAAPKTGSDVGSLWPFIQSQAVQGEFPLSFLRDEFTRPAGLEAAGPRQAPGAAALRPAAVRPAARGRRAGRPRRPRAREGPLQHHARPPRARLRAHPQGARPARPRPSSPCTTTAGSTSGARRSSSRSADEHPVLDRVQEDGLRGQEHRHGAGPSGIRRDRHRHVLLGRAADAAGRRPGRLARAAPRHAPPSGSPPSTGGPRRASSSSAGRSTRPASPGRA